MKIFNQQNRVQLIVAVVALVLFAFSVYTYKIYQWGIDSATMAAALEYSDKAAAHEERQGALQAEKQAANRRADAALVAKSKTDAENDLLRQQAEINAQLLRESDIARRRDQAAKLNQIIEERKNEIEKIQSVTDYGSNVCALCDDLARTNPEWQLSFCGKCRRGASPAASQPDTR